MNKTVVIATSGGLDSTTLLAYELEKEKNNVIAVPFSYGSKHEQYELYSCEKVLNYYKEKIKDKLKIYKTINLSNIFKGMKSSLLKENNIDIPEGYYNEENQKSTVVPARNLIFLSILTSIAIDNNCEEIALGIHKGDSATYPDCRIEFFKAAEQAAYLASDSKVKFVAPFVDMTKAEIVKIGLEIKVPYAYTRSCYKDQFISCGKCGTCMERIEAFKLNGVNDPIAYDSDDDFYKRKYSNMMNTIDYSKFYNYTLFNEIDCKNAEATCC